MESQGQGASKPCKTCKGSGQHIREAFTTVDGSNGHFAARAYYVWRLARFHGGKDMTMPVMASLVVNGDPFRDELDALSESAARKYLGSDLHATMRWGCAFGIL